LTPVDCPGGGYGRSLAIRAATDLTVENANSADVNKQHI
jgi:hypothetical protein